MASDALDILQIEANTSHNSSQTLTAEQLKESLFSDDSTKKKPPKKPKEHSFKSKLPPNMSREVYALMYEENIDAAASVIPSDTHQGYKQMRMNLGKRKVRPWKWMPFTNPARKDGAIFYHWRRVEDEGKDYVFARFNKKVEVLSYTDMEYRQHLQCDGWNREETDYLMKMCMKFDRRFIIINDRWDKLKFGVKSIIDLKERYYSIANTISRVRDVPGHEVSGPVYDAQHERRRIKQLEKLYNRTTEQVEDEEYLMAELKKIEQRKRERDRKTQDLQKLISAADSSTDMKRLQASLKSASLKKKLPSQKSRDSTVPETTGIKFPEFKAAGVTLRSQRIKLPSSVGQKKTKAIEQLVEELSIELNPMPTEEIGNQFNELRCDMVLLYELKVALTHCEFEKQTLNYRFKASAPKKLQELVPRLPVALSTPGIISHSILSASSSSTATTSSESPSKNKKISELIDVGAAASTTPSRKRRAALEQSNVLKKLKKS